MRIAQANRYFYISKLKRNIQTFIISEGSKHGVLAIL